MEKSPYIINIVADSGLSQGFGRKFYQNMNSFAEELRISSNDDILDSVASDNSLSINGNIFQDVGRSLRELLKTKHLCDGIIKTEDGSTFGVHCIIVSAVSPLFRLYFATLSPLPVRVVSVPHIHSEIMEVILNFAYTGEVVVSMANVDRLVTAAKIVQIPEIVKECVAFMSKELNEKNCMNIYDFAKLHGCSDLKITCWKFILSKFQQIAGFNSDLFRLSLSEMESLLLDDRLNVKAEEFVYYATSRWTCENFLQRSKYFPLLLQCIRFGRCNYVFFNSLSEHTLIRDNSECLEQIHTISLNMQAHRESRSGDIRNSSDIRNPLFRPRVPYEIIFAIGGWSAGSATVVVETYDNRADKWCLCEYADNMPRAYHGLVSLHQMIYMIGGFDGNQCFNTVRCFDPVEHIWSEKACMYTARCYVSVATLSDNIYALGGYNGHVRVNTVERYDSLSNQWSMVASMHHIRSDASASDLNGKIYITGGFNGQQVLDSAESYDPLTNMWTDIRQMSTARSGVNLITYNGSLYVVGGFNGATRLSSMEKYDARHDLWLPVASMTSPRSNFATAAVEGHLYAIGGFNGLSTFSHAERYDSRTNSWTSVTKTNLNRSALSACVISGLPNAREFSFLGTSNADSS